LRRAPNPKIAGDPEGDGLKAKGNLEVRMSKAWFSGAMTGAAAILAGCVSGDGYYVDAYGQKYDAARVKCITAPIGYVVPDDIYTQKYGQPWGIRCTAGKVPAIVSHDPDGAPIEVPVIPVPPVPPAADPENYSLYANSTNLLDVVGAGVVVTDKKGITTVIVAAPDTGSSVKVGDNTLSAKDALKQSQDIMKQTQDAVHAQVDKDLAKN
jgi:hypothetical protein